MDDNTLNEEGPPRKRLLTDPNPKKPTFVTESPESTVSFDSSSDRLAKKTRELPNLSDCHSCGVRINYTNPRDRLQPLDSLWRIVLLCKKCTKQVNSSDLCTYCFNSVVVVNDCFKCRNCHHSVHKDCVVKYGPGPGLGLGLGFSVCVDCWVPEAVAKSITRKRKLVKKNEACGQSGRVSVGEKRKVVCAIRAGESDLRKRVVAKSAVELAKGVLKGGEGGGNGMKVVDDAELAFLLHRAINSSPRISRFTCVVSSVRKDDAPVICYSKRRVGEKVVLMGSSGLDVPLIRYSRRRKGCLRDSASLDASLMCYSRRRSVGKACLHAKGCECFVCKESQRTDQDGSTSFVDTKPRRYDLKYYRIGKGTPRSSVSVDDSDCCSCMGSADLYKEGMPDTTNLRNGNDFHEVSENCDGDNRFLLKYKRCSKYKPKFSCEVEGFSPMLPVHHLVERATLSSQ